jgi:DNA polymerase-3 subunit delta
VENFMGITFLQGGEAILAERSIAEILERNSGSVITQLTGGEIELGAITDALAPSLFGDERVIVVKEIQDLGSELSEEITSYLANPDESVELVLWHKGGIKGKALVDAIKKSNPKIILCETLKKDGDKSEFIRQEFARLGRKVNNAAVQALLDALGSDMREVSGAISQLAADVAADKTIDEASVAKYQQGRIETTGFDVADAAMEGKRDIALVALRNALATGTDPVLIISALASSLRTLGKVSGAPRSAKSFELAGSLGLAPWQIEKARRQLAGWSPDSLTAAVIAVAQADADIKGAAADPIHSLERALLVMTSRK